LNNVYALSLKKSSLATDALKQLDRVMEYMLVHSNKEWVSLQLEIQYLMDFIHLQKLRMRFPENLTFKTDIINNNVMIAPLILVTLVENAFKHGDTFHKEAEIAIRLTQKENMIEFSVVNTVSSKKISSSEEGLGLKNVKRRLDLIYPLRHNIRLSEDKKEYHANLLLNAD
jgi:two-component system, LytTR family, sensor kinase